MKIIGRNNLLFKYHWVLLSIYSSYWKSKIEFNNIYFIPVLSWNKKECNLFPSIKTIFWSAKIFVGNPFWLISHTLAIRKSTFNFHLIINHPFIFYIIENQQIFWKLFQKERIYFCWKMFSINWMYTFIFVVIMFLDFQSESVGLMYVNSNNIKNTFHHRFQH